MSARYSTFARLPLALIPLQAVRRATAPLHLQKLHLRRWEVTQTPSRFDRVTARLPRFLRWYLVPLRAAPASHVAAFLVLHELTAVVPLVGLAATFHYTGWLPGWFAEGAWVKAGVERFGKYARKKGWIGEGEAGEALREVGGDRQKPERWSWKDGRWRGKWWERGEGGVRLLVEFGFATAYAVTKALLPLRLIFSIWATPWFARVSVIPAFGRIKKWVGRRRVGSTNTAPQTSTSKVEGGGAVDAKAVPKGVPGKN